MHIHHSMEKLPDIPSPVVTMGSFDGVHAGHRVIISRLNKLAASCGGESVLITFDPHPRKVLYPESAGKDLRLISTLQEKCMLLEETGLDHLVVMPFSRAFSRISSQDFVARYLHGKLQAHTIVVGFNHFFGHNKQGNFDSLHQSRRRYGFRVEEIPEQEIQNETVSSTKIRAALQQGNIQRANAYLEHHFLMNNKLLLHAPQSASLGRKCYQLTGTDPHKLCPPEGAYAASLVLGGATKKALVHLGQAAILVLPEQEDLELGGAPVPLHFHKYLGGGRRSVSSDLHDISELIY